ncbi:Leucine-zipper-like transcriptional regulator 1, partial [Dimargaris cristalligena]
MHTRFAQSPLGYFGGLSLLVLVPQAVALNNFTISNFTSVFLENRITTFSGVNSPEPPNLTYINWSYSLDLSESVQTNKPTWENDAVSRVGAPQVQSAAAVAVTVPSGPSVFLYGGDCRPTDVGNSSLFIYSWKDQDWSRPTVSIPRRYSPSAVWAPKYNRIVYFGGSRVTDKCGSTYEATDDLVFMDPVSLSISTSSVTDSRPTPRFGHRAVMLDDDRMAIIGGYGNVRTAANRVYVYHLGLDRWAYQDLDGIDFSNFINFSAV